MDFHCHCIASKRKWRKSKVKVIPRKRNIVDGTTASNLTCVPPSPPAHNCSDLCPGVTQFSNPRFVWNNLLIFVLLFDNRFFRGEKWNSQAWNSFIYKWIFIVGVKNKAHWMCLQSMDVVCFWCVLTLYQYNVSKVSFHKGTQCIVCLWSPFPLSYCWHQQGNRC